MASTLRLYRSEYVLVVEERRGLDFRRPRLAQRHLDVVHHLSGRTKRFHWSVTGQQDRIPCWFAFNLSLMKTHSFAVCSASFFLSKTTVPTRYRGRGGRDRRSTYFRRLGVGLGLADAEDALVALRQLLDVVGLRPFVPAVTSTAIGRQLSQLQTKNQANNMSFVTCCRGRLRRGA